MINENLFKIMHLLHRPSVILHHDKPCCNNALGWLRGIDFSKFESNKINNPPAWLKDYFKWSPHAWPIYWCDLPEMRRLDCGGLAAVATELFRMRGSPVLQTQLALQYPHSMTSAWQTSWVKEVNHSAWISGNICYHEACSLINADGKLQIWDPTENRWLQPPITNNQQYGRIMAVKLYATNKSQEEVRWFDRVICFNEWIVIDADYR